MQDQMNRKMAYFTPTPIPDRLTVADLAALDAIFRHEPILTLTEGEIDELGRLDAAKRANLTEFPHEL